MKGLKVSLVAAGDGGEVIRHQLGAGSAWAIGPSEGWTSMEFVYVVSGELHWTVDGQAFAAKPGDSLSAVAISRDTVFTCPVDTEFLYFSTQPVFHHYSVQLRELMQLAVSIEQKDGYTADHCNRIKDLSMRIGQEMGLTSSQLYNLNIASFLHDVGKIRVPLPILNKPSTLSAAEWDVMKRHTSFGRQMLEETNLPMLTTAAQIVEQHHERRNGSGYPFGLAGDDIRLEAAIVAVADSFDAMTTDRPYQKARSAGDAKREIREKRGILYHPDVVDAFLSLADRAEI
ncbi:MAG: HD domain-containing protein [Alicyclobacillus sp.]|nr:HD domain-containing protein [Alicyclobacillus sp.]